MVLAQVGVLRVHRREDTARIAARHRAAEASARAALEAAGARYVLLMRVAERCAKRAQSSGGGSTEGSGRRKGGGDDSGGTVKVDGEEKKEDEEKKGKGRERGTHLHGRMHWKYTHSRACAYKREA